MGVLAIEEMRRADAGRRQALAELPLRLVVDRARVDRAFAEIRREPDWAGVTHSFDLLAGALGALGALVRGEPGASV